MRVTKFSPLFSLIWELEILVTFRTLIVELIVLLGVLVKVCSHLTSFSPFNADLFKGPFVYEKWTEKCSPDIF